MIVLALDTAGSGCFAAVYDTTCDMVLAQAGADIGQGHAEKLMAFVDKALSAAGRSLGEIDRIAVTIGPGSFTGIRVGVAAARGFALALGVPAVGVSTLAVVARSAGASLRGRPVFAVMDAKRDEVYCQTFEASGHPRTEAMLCVIDEARRMAADFDGDIVGSGRDLMLGLDPVGEAEGPRYLADIGTVARLGAQANAALGKPKPLYLRGPDARPSVGFAVTRA